MEALDLGRRSLALVVLLVIWSVAGYLSVRERRQRRRTSGSARNDARCSRSRTRCCSHPARTSSCSARTTRRTGRPGRSADQHSDSMMLLRTDPSRHRLVYLSIPRDLRASIPGYGEQKINAAMQIGGPKLAMQTADQLFGPGLPGQSRRRRRLRCLHAADRRSRRHRRQRAAEHPLEPVRLSVLDADSLLAMAGVALPQGRAAHGRPPCAHLLARPREPAQPGRHRHQPRRCASNRSCRRR